MEEFINHSERHLRRLNKEDTRNPDLTIRFRNSAIRLNRKAFTSCCMYRNEKLFKDALDRHPNDKTLRIDEHDSAATLVIAYIHLGTLSTANSDLTELLHTLELSHRCGLHWLKSALTDVIYNRIDRTNWLDTKRTVAKLLTKEEFSEISSKLTKKCWESVDGDFLNTEAFQCLTTWEFIELMTHKISPEDCGVTDMEKTYLNLLKWFQRHEVLVKENVRIQAQNAIRIVNELLSKSEFSFFAHGNQNDQETINQPETENDETSQQHETENVHDRENDDTSQQTATENVAESQNDETSQQTATEHVAEREINEEVNNHPETIEVPGGFVSPRTSFPVPMIPNYHEQIINGNSQSASIPILLEDPTIWPSYPSDLTIFTFKLVRERRINNVRFNLTSKCNYEIAVIKRDGSEIRFPMYRNCYGTQNYYFPNARSIYACSVQVHLSRQIPIENMEVHCAAHVMPMRGDYISPMMNVFGPNTAFIYSKVLFDTSGLVDNSDKTCLRIKEPLEIRFNQPIFLTSLRVWLFDSDQVKESFTIQTCVAHEEEFKADLKAYYDVNGRQDYYLKAVVSGFTITPIKGQRGRDEVHIVRIEADAT